MKAQELFISDILPEKNPERGSSFYKPMHVTKKPLTFVVLFCSLESTINVTSVAVV